MLLKRNLFDYFIGLCHQLFNQRSKLTWLSSKEQQNSRNIPIIYIYGSETSVGNQLSGSLSPFTPKAHQPEAPGIRQRHEIYIFIYPPSKEMNGSRKREICFIE